MRRNFFNSEEVGYFKTQKRPAPPTNPMTDPNAMSDMLKGNMTNVLPMIIIGGWINWAFSGFVTSKLPLMNLQGKKLSIFTSLFSQSSISTDSSLQAHASKRC